MGSTMDLKGHIKRHSANNIDRSASIRTSSDSPYGSVENKRGSQNTHCPQAEKKPRLEKYDAGSSAIGRRDDDEHLKRWTGPQSSPLEIQMVDGSAETGPKNGRASDLPHARERCGKFPFVKKTSATNQSCCEQVSSLLSSFFKALSDLRPVLLCRSVHRYGMMLKRLLDCRPS